MYDVMVSRKVYAYLTPSNSSIGAPASGHWASVQKSEGLEVRCCACLHGGCRILVGSQHPPLAPPGRTFSRPIVTLSSLTSWSPVCCTSYSAW